MKEQERPSDEALKRSAVYALLSRAYLQEPDRKLIRYFRSAAVQEILTGLALDLGDDFLTQDEDLLVEELALEYAGLFLAPPTHLPPFESFFVGGLRDSEETFTPALQGNAAEDVLAFYREHGILLPQDLNLLPDHIGVELEALRLFCALEAKAAAAGQQSLARRYRQITGQFLTEHPKRWINAFCDGILQRTENPFYRVVAEVTRVFVESEIEELTPGRAEMEDVIQ